MFVKRNEEICILKLYFPYNLVLSQTQLIFIAKYGSFRILQNTATNLTNLGKVL